MMSEIYRIIFLYFSHESQIGNWNEKIALVMVVYTINDIVLKKRNNNATTRFILPESLGFSSRDCKPNYRLVRSDLGDIPSPLATATAIDK